MEDRGSYLLILKGLFHSHQWRYFSYEPQGNHHATDIGRDSWGCTIWVSIRICNTCCMEEQWKYTGPGVTCSWVALPPGAQIPLAKLSLNPKRIVAKPILLPPGARLPPSRARLFAILANSLGDLIQCIQVISAKVVYDERFNVFIPRILKINRRLATRWHLA